MTAHHAFLDLDPTDRAEWLSDFSGAQKLVSRIGPSFPSLDRGQSPSEWLMAQYQGAANSEGLRDRLRRTVVDVAAALGRKPANAERNQALGTLLEVAGKFEFTELAPDLADWTRKKWLGEGHVYQLDGARMPLRRTVWELLIAWKKLDSLGPQLRSDLVHLIEENEPGTAQLCFVALGEREPGSAIEMIPFTVPLWHMTYWNSTVHNFFTSHGPVELLRDVYERSWARCFGRCFYDYAFVDRYLRSPRLLTEFDTNRPNRLFLLLNEVGITVVQGKSSVRLSSPHCPPLVVDVGKQLESLVQSTRLSTQHHVNLYQEQSSRDAVW